MNDWTTVRISKASLALLRARGERDGLSTTNCLHRLIEAAEAAPEPPFKSFEYVNIMPLPAERDTRGPDPERMTPGERARWERKRGVAC